MTVTARPSLISDAKISAAAATTTITAMLHTGHCNVYRICTGAKQYQKALSHKQRSRRLSKQCWFSHSFESIRRRPKHQANQQWQVRSSSKLIGLGVEITQTALFRLIAGCAPHQRQRWTESYLRANSQALCLSLVQVAAGMSVLLAILWFALDMLLCFFAMPLA